MDSDLQAGDKAVPGRVNYQIFTSGVSLKYTFLLNVNTGVSWVLAENKENKELIWQAMR
jgi:hypothetical protein